MSREAKITETGLAFLQAAAEYVGEAKDRETREHAMHRLRRWLEDHLDKIERNCVEKRNGAHALFGGAKLFINGESRIDSDGANDGFRRW